MQIGSVFRFPRISNKRERDLYKCMPPGCSVLTKFGFLWVQILQDRPFFFKENVHQTSWMTPSRYKNGLSSPLSVRNLRGFLRPKIKGNALLQDFGPFIECKSRVLKNIPTNSRCLFILPSLLLIVNTGRRNSLITSLRKQKCLIGHRTSAGDSDKKSIQGWPAGMWWAKCLSVIQQLRVPH